MHKTTLRYGIVFSVLLALIVITAACKTTPPPVSGLLGDYSEFKADPKDESMLWWEKSGVDWDTYTKLMIDPVKIYLHEGSEADEIEDKKLQELAGLFRTTVIEVVQDVFPIVNEPGEDVLTIRAAITDVKTASAGANIVTSAVIGVPFDMGGAAMEAEFLDALSGDRLAAVVDKKKGSPVALNLEAYSKYGHTEAAFAEWAEGLKKALVEE
ncbi:MAG: hypothetical protein MAG794_00778 [Gammaproteobacteria bacterium]|nr:hypothetical protein [Gammaproteobacteria bacterium]